MINDSTVKVPLLELLAWILCNDLAANRHLQAIQPRHGGEASVKCGPAKRARSLKEARRKPEPARDGTVIWSLKTLGQALRKAPNGFPELGEVKKPIA